jgi:hypothetical protein
MMGISPIMSRGKDRRCVGSMNFSRMEMSSPKSFSSPKNEPALNVVSTPDASIR